MNKGNISLKNKISDDENEDKMNFTNHNVLI